MKIAKRPPRELISLTVVGLIFVLTVIGMYGMEHSIRHSPNEGWWGGLLIFPTAILLGSLGVSTLACWLISIFNSSPLWRISGLLSGCTALLLAAYLSPLLRMVQVWSERRDFAEVGMDRLRQEAEALVKSAPSRNYELRWFGGEVPKSDWPEIFKGLVHENAYLTVDDHGVVLVTDGLGGWRAGYKILPPGSTHVPAHSRRIAEGFYYVGSSHGGGSTDESQ